MKPSDFDPNRPYNRDAINKEQKKRAYLMDLEALKKGREYDGLPELGEADLKKDLKINPQLKLYYDVYTGEILRGGDCYDFEHILSAHFLHSILKATHTDEEIAIITNASKNVGVTRRDLNNHKKKHNLKDYILDHNEKVQRYKINKNIAKRALIEAEASASLLSGIDIPRSYGNVRDAKLNYNPERKISHQSAAALSNSSNVFYSNKFLKSNLSLILQILTKIPYKIISLSLALILVIILFLWIMDVIPFNSNINNTALVPQKEKIENEYKNEPEKDLAKTNLSFAKPLDDLTKSITDISEFKSILENENTIPVIGSMF